MRDIPNPKLYDEALAEITDGVRKDLLAQIDTLRLTAENEQLTLDKLLSEFSHCLETMERYTNNVRSDKYYLDRIFLESPIRKHLSVASDAACNWGFKQDFERDYE